MLIILSTNNYNFSAKYDTLIEKNTTILQNRSKILQKCNKYSQSIAMGPHEFFHKDFWDRFMKIFI